MVERPEESFPVNTMPLKYEQVVSLQLNLNTIRKPGLIHGLRFRQVQFQQDIPEFVVGQNFLSLLRFFCASGEQQKPNDR